MAVQIEVDDGKITAYLEGEIDHHAAREMREEIDMSAGRTGARELILDFRGVTFMDSSGIGLVMGRFALMKELGGTLRVSNQPDHIKKVMKLAGLDRLTESTQGGRAL